MKIRNPIRLKSRSKYGAVKTTVDGITFDSKKEARRFSELKLMQQIGLIDSLELQVKYPLVVERNLICTYIADFVYFDKESRKLVAEDVKGFRTPEYRLKKKLFEALMRIQIREV